jgi:hypothetical protein
LSPTVSLTTASIRQPNRSISCWCFTCIRYYSISPRSCSRSINSRWSLSTGPIDQMWTCTW